MINPPKQVSSIFESDAQRLLSELGSTRQGLEILRKSLAEAVAGFKEKVRIEDAEFDAAASKSLIKTLQTEVRILKDTLHYSESRAVNNTDNAANRRGKAFRQLFVHIAYICAMVLEFLLIRAWL